ncbi:MAG: PQQ-binding-like beta-propeller repeat protein [Phycisphaerae bacterium]|nr:PQQ-binding-like beta-propeller repeat protein [Phycisphaerae bacterium]
MKPARPFAGALVGPMIGTLILTLAGVAVAAPADEAKRILEATGIQGGLVVHIGCADGTLTAALGDVAPFIIHGLDRDAANIEKARAAIQSRGLADKVSVEQWSRPYLPYADDLVSLVVAEDPGSVPMNEIMRVLRPLGVAYVKESGKWTKTVKPWPDDIDEWSHYLHDATGNAVASDARVAPPRHLRWVTGPKHGRSHEIDTTVCALVSSRGRLFYILDEGLTGITDQRLPQRWALIARDAFSGVLLWRRPLPDWGWTQWKRADLVGKDWTGLRGQRTRSPLVLPRRLVADGDRVYVTLGYHAPLSALDAATGKTIRVYDETEDADEILCADGVLVICIRQDPDAADRRRGNPVHEPIVAINADTGQVLWKTQAERVLPLSLAVGDGRVCFHDFKQVVCHDLKSGKALWNAPVPGGGSMWGTGHTLVVHEKAVLFLGPRKLVALSADTGKQLWSADGGKGPGASNPPDLFVVDGLVWYGGPEGKHRKDSTEVRKSGRDLMTGQVKRVVDVSHLMSPLHHFRCYRSKATQRYLLWTKRGAEFLDVRADDHMRHDWLRAPCKLGFTPCNGLLYVPSAQCFCYPGVRLDGFNALSAKATARADGADAKSDRIERGPAYGKTAAKPKTTAADWPTYRHDPERSGSTPSAVPAKIDQLWQTDLGGKLTPPVACNGKLYVASIDQHRVCCLDAASGKTLWCQTAGGRIDSPPTIHKGLVLFGAADGWVYCLRASDGQLAWRFRAAPLERRIVAFGQLESAWPVHGTVLVKDDVAYVAAGRSSYLDGGIHLYGLEPETGKVLYETRVEGPYPDPKKDTGRPFDMDGAQADVLVTDGDLLYMRLSAFDPKLVEREAPRITAMGDRKVGRHLMATTGMLDDSGWNRSFWTYSERWPGYYIANQSPKAGQLLVFDDKTTCGVKCFTRRNRHSPMFFPQTDGYLLFADDNDTEPMLYDKSQAMPKPVKWLPDVNPKVGFPLDDNAVDRDKGTGFTRAKPPKWAEWVPVRVRAMVLAGKTLFVAGPPDVLEPDDPLGAFQGRKGAVLRAVSSEDGSKLSEARLDCPPVFDGMIAADGRLYLSTNGKVLCFAGKQ